MKLIFLFYITIFLFAACQKKDEKKEKTQFTISKDTLTIALDWSPNVLHAGIFVAQEKGWYDSVGLHVKWFSTEIDNYEKKPIQRIQDREVDLAIGPTEHILYYSALHKGAPQIQAIGTILQEHMSAFITKASFGFNSTNCSFS